MIGRKSWKIPLFGYKRNQFFHRNKLEMETSTKSKTIITVSNTKQTGNSNVKRSKTKKTSKSTKTSTKTSTTTSNTSDDKVLPKKQTLTPYQGTKKQFGDFKCSCGQTWKSGHSWANTTQKCLSCGTAVYPFSQCHLKKVKIFETKKPHRDELCGKCIKLGRSCTNFKEIIIV